MRKVNLVKYFIFVDNNDVPIARYSTLEELMLHAKDFVDNVDNQIGKSTLYIGIGGDFSYMNDDGTRRYGAYDFINRKVGCEKFSFCKDAEENDIEI